VLVVTGFVFIGQVIGFINQVVTAALFGAGASMDAFLAANAVPQYIIAVILSALGFVFVPVFVDYMAAGQEKEAWRVASTVINVCLLAIGLLVILGVLIPDTILRVTTPGLKDATQRLAVQIAIITWPSVMATGVITLLTGIYQSQSRFGWPAAVPVIGAIVNIFLLILLAKWFDIIGLATATTLGLVIQVGLLLSIVLQRGRYQLILDWRHPGVIQVFYLMWPLVLGNLVAKITPLIDRFLASSMPVGSISHLGYAFRLLSVMGLLISTGITTVIFPNMATKMAESNLAGLKSIISKGLRFMWLGVAPTMAIGIPLALPLVSTVFRHGQFASADALAVAGLLQIYLLSLAPACLANITGRGFYVLKDTRTVAVIGSIESVAYVIYTAFLAHSFGVAGIVLGYVILFTISFLWQIFVLRYKTGNVGGRAIINSFIRTSLAAIFAGVAALLLSKLSTNMLVQLIVGSASGLVVYTGALFLFKVSEARVLWQRVFGEV
jgi:putative peptidoglycan lipid II flippase